DPTTTSGPNHGHGTPHGLPVFTVIGGTNVTFENQIFAGVDAHGYDPAVAFQHAIQLQGTIGATVSHVKIRKLFGDGIDLEPLRGGSDHKSGGIINPSENVTISDVSIVGTGRNGITMASADGVTVTNVTMSNIGRDAFDLESDQSTEGAKNVLINGCTYNQLFNIKSAGTHTGPITVENCTMQRHSSGGWALNIDNPQGVPDAGPIVFNNDLFLCGASVYVACFNLVGATNLTVENSTARLGFPGDAIHEAPYSARAHTGASFTNDLVSGYGRCCKVVGGSTVTVTGGSWIKGDVLASTYATLTQSNSTVTYGAESADVFTVTVTGQGGPGGPPTGLVTVADTATTTTICSFTLPASTGTSATGSCSPTDFAFTGGTTFTSVAASYDGDGHHWASISTPQSFSVSSAPVGPTGGPMRGASRSTSATAPSIPGTSLSVSTTTVGYGSEGAAIATASVTGLPGGDPPLGTVTLTDLNDGSTICTAGLTPGGDIVSTAVCTVPDTQFPPGTSPSVAAVWNGDDNYSGSESSSQDLAIVASTSATTLSQSASTVSYGSESADTLTVSVTGQPGGPAPAGSVPVQDSSSGDVICTADLIATTANASTGSCTPSDTEFPGYTTFTAVRANWGGDSNYSPSSSSPDQGFTVAYVSSSTSTTALSQSTSSVSYGAESADLFTVTVTGQPGNPAPAGGPVDVTDITTGKLICVAPLTPGSGDVSTGSCRTPNKKFKAGTSFTSVEAVWGGDTNYSPSSSFPDQSFSVLAAAAANSARGAGATTCTSLSGKAVSLTGSLAGCTASTTGGKGRLTGSGVVDTAYWKNGGTTTFNLASQIVNRSRCASGGIELRLTGAVTKSTGSAAPIKGAVSALVCFTGLKHPRVSLLPGTVFKF
ncbi:MAG TPA: right-handed parallel beta-helix repeat-containing protein, partial [Acidimicrobiales bacterium]